MKRDKLTIEERLTRYAKDRDDLTGGVPPIDQVDLNNLLAEVRAQQLAGSGNTKKSGLLGLSARRWRILLCTASAATACVVLLLDIPFQKRDGLMQLAAVGGSDTNLSAVPHLADSTQVAPPATTSDETSNPDNHKEVAVAAAPASKQEIMAPDNVVITKGPEKIVTSAPEMEIPVAQPIAASLSPQIASAQAVAAPIVSAESARPDDAATVQIEKQIPAAPAVAPTTAGPTVVASTAETESQARWKNPNLPILRTTQSIDGTFQLNALDPFGAIFPDSKFVNRNITPILALWSVETNEQLKTTRKAFLWFIYRDSESPSEGKRSFLLGIFQQKRSSDGSKTFRFLGIPISRSKN